MTSYLDSNPEHNNLYHLIGQIISEVEFGIRPAAVNNIIFPTRHRFKKFIGC